MTVRCQTPLGKVVDEFAPVQMEGDAVEIGFNNRYLLDALRYSKCEKMVLEINGPLSPVKLLPEDGKDFIYLVCRCALRTRADYGKFVSTLNLSNWTPCSNSQACARQAARQRS